MTFIDELSGHVQLFLLKKKSEVLARFKEVQARLNNQNNTTSLKMFVSDGGGEYISAEFSLFLKEKGIDHI